MAIGILCTPYVHFIEQEHFHFSSISHKSPVECCSHEKQQCMVYILLNAVNKLPWV